MKKICIICNAKISFLKKYKLNKIYKILSKENNVEIFNLSGQRVLKTNLTNAQGFYNKEVDLGSLNSGVYMLKFNSGNYQKIRKIVIQ